MDQMCVVEIRTSMRGTLTCPRFWYPFRRATASASAFPPMILTAQLLTKTGLAVCPRSLSVKSFKLKAQQTATEYARLARRAPSRLAISSTCPNVCFFCAADALGACSALGEHVPCGKCVDSVVQCDLDSNVYDCLCGGVVT